MVPRCQEWSINPGDGAFNKTTNREKGIKTRTNVGTKVIINPNKQQNR